jgi:hypothetical protein
MLLGTDGDAAYACFPTAGAALDAEIGLRGRVRSIGPGQPVTLRVGVEGVPMRHCEASSAGRGLTALGLRLLVGHLLPVQLETSRIAAAAAITGSLGSALRLSSAAGPDEILVSPEIASALEAERHDLAGAYRAVDPEKRELRVGST